MRPLMADGVFGDEQGNAASALTRSRISTLCPIAPCVPGAVHASHNAEIAMFVAVGGFMWSLSRLS